MAKKRVVILGAGLAGLSTAWHLQRKGIDCLVLEKESEVGGLCRSKQLDGFTFDYDGHLLHFKQQYTFKLIESLLKDNLIEHRRNAWVYSYGRYIRYPFQANLYGLSSSIIKECLLEFVKASQDSHLKRKKNLTFLDWINCTFGKGIAKHFMVPYNSKFWTVPPQELTCEWLDGFIPVPSLSQIIEGTIEENKRQFGYNAQFWYPRRGGIASLSWALANQIKNIYTNCQIVEINLKRKEIKMASGNKERFDFLISTLPLPEIPYLIKGIPKQIYALFKKLRWNSIFNLNLGIGRKDFDGRHWVYFPQRETCFFRVGFFHNFSPSLTPRDKSSLYVEVAYSPNKSIDKNKVVLHIKKDLRKMDIISQSDRICVEDINDIKYGYPIYDNNYCLARENILKFLNQNYILSCGRYGSWRYMSMEDVILEGRYTSERIKCIIR